MSGKSGNKGRVGKKGQRGEQGREPAWRENLLRKVQEQIGRVDHELDVQLRRMAQIQVEVDELRSNMHKLFKGRG